MKQHIFKNTKTDNTFSDIIPISTNIVSTFEALQTDNLYAIIFDNNGGAGSRADAGIPYGTEYTILSSDETGITRDGYTFTLWNTSSDGAGTSYSSNDIITLTGDIILYAQWIYNDTTYSNPCREEYY